MKPMLKAFTVWTVVVYVFSLVVATVGKSFTDHRVAFDVLVAFHLHLAYLCNSAIVAAIGTVLLWVLPIQNKVLCILSGVVISWATVALLTWGLITFRGGFEENINYEVGALIVLIPTSIGGAYAGAVRAVGAKIARSTV